ncbi:predicted protein [Chaetomium globosum CBS 148.51]|uniref:CFEM domain-containing protein n=1 Tax=Chaetomium globosum (strain ATCC 6205 / CBS 148.51 / DSM 1962 / NBRC 6347 / NRRL 1970) TaxID=306901 RepID=Q2HHL3_CHAGB|nr:uncharacterized protein CHGG_00291 [Chaetomium globosum CBS 148.51]EAQ92056.1 predicted protein [Chaetomium globosum CBS 148.51]
MLSMTKAVAGFVLATTGVLALDGGAAIVTPAPCGGDNPCAPQISAVPGCATSCIESAASDLGCVGDDYSCHCAKYDAIQGSAINCVIGACGLGGALGVPGAVDALCSCVTAHPATPCEEPTSSAALETTTSTTTIDTNTSTPTTPKPTPTPACPGTECSFPSAAEHECVTSCIDTVLPEFGCNGLEDWNCYCNNFRKISNRAFACAYACGADVYAAFNNPASQGCTCLLKECPPRSSSSPTSSTIESSSSSTTIIDPEPTPTTTTTTPPPPTSTCTPSDPSPCAPLITAIPACATSCIVSAASAVGCGDDNFACRCSSSDAIQQTAIGCVLGACALDEALRVVDAVGELCACVTGEAGQGPTGCGGGGEVTVTASATGGEETGTSAAVTSTGGGGASGSFVTETRTVAVTTSVCDDDDGTATTTTSRPTCSLGCGGDDGGDDGGDGDGDGSDEEGDDGGDEDGDFGPGPSPSHFPSGIPGGENEGNDGGDGSGAGGGSTTSPKPPIETAGASHVTLAWIGSLIAMIVTAVALL